MTTIPCPHCGEPIQPAQLLGTLSKGKPKRLSQEERAAKAARLAKVRYLRHKPAPAQTETIYEDGEVFHPPCPRCGSRSTDCGCD